MNSVVKDIIVKIKADNHAAISFYKKLGFGEFYHPQFNKDIKTMSIDLANRYC